MKVKNKKQALLELISELKIGSSQKAQLALVFLGLKPAIELDIFTNNDSIDFIILVLTKELNLCVINLGITNQKIEKAADTLVISKNAVYAQNLANLISLRKHESAYPKEYHILYGVLMGYPLTAVDAFITKKCLPSKKQEDLTQDLCGIDVFRFSKHYEYELLQVKKWYEVLKKECPKILKEMKN